MSVLQVRALQCDHEGCPATIADAGHLDAISARMDGARKGWTYRPAMKGPSGPRGGSGRIKSLSADFCPEHSGVTK